MEALYTMTLSTSRYVHYMTVVVVVALLSYAGVPSCLMHDWAVKKKKSPHYPGDKHPVISNALPV